MEPKSSPYLDQTHAGAYLGLSPRTLERFRIQGRGPTFLKLGRRVLYARDDLESWAATKRRRSTSDSTVPGVHTRIA